ncbi:PilZ domain-containing protein [Paludicola sp. MB14-C6]|uniref:PilZ domain-containing protein n=1 Tax=Paludihabitans sp. MB14-C6 TaxID=3070656 RepID=UPI0027DC37D3|nr:PilZ domain-containing protein [Paludicola sp. MB14-C6]WMJ22543.1 PilZ domain-containing protein [Paludicola sp. MB14-C6]
MLPISENYINSLCELKTIENRVLCAGYIQDVNEEYVEIHYRDDTKLLLAANTLIKVSIFNEKLGFKVLIGRVFIGTNDFVRLVEVVTLMDFEKREFFRINIFEHATLYKKLVTTEEIHYTEVPSIEVIVSNISLCGIYFISEEEFELNQTVYVLLDLPQTLSVFPCIIQRIQPENDKYGYGCEFTDNDQRQMDNLYKYIYLKQVEFLRKSREAES